MMLCHSTVMASTTDSIRCDSTTHLRSCKHVLFEALEPIWVKGKAERIPVYKPITGAVSAALSLRKIPMIGRDGDMSLIELCVDRFSNTSESSAILIQGSAGMGKSKILNRQFVATMRCLIPYHHECQALTHNP